MSEDFRKIELEDWRAAIETTLLGPIELMRTVVDGMAQRGFGRVVNIATAAAKQPMEVRLLSGPPRSALVNYTVAISKALGRHNVAVNNILPGMYFTDAMHERLDQEMAAHGTTREQEIAKMMKIFGVPAGRFGDPDDLGDFVAMFCSRQANFTIGQSLVIDGGSVRAIF